MEKLSNIKSFRDRNIVIEGMDAATRMGWTGVPNVILDMRTISPGAKLTYAILLKYARENNYCYPGQARVAKDIGTSRQTINAYIRELSNANIITVERRGQGKSNKYHLSLKASFWTKIRR